MSVEWLIVGLGNPGKEYATTRHNIGWMVCNSLFAPKEMPWKPGKGMYLFAEIAIRRVKTMVILPTTYMNNSGEAAADLLQRTNLPSEKMIVIADEYNFPVGKIHLKKDGSDGGHNGIASIIQHIGTANFWRLRCGIGRDFEPGGMADYVLSPFKDDDDTAGMIEKARKALLLFVAGDNRQHAISLINSDRI